LSDSSGVDIVVVVMVVEVVKVVKVVFCGGGGDLEYHSS
jgi:hypothetical protein